MIGFPTFLGSLFFLHFLHFYCCAVSWSPSVESGAYPRELEILGWLLLCKVGQQKS